MTFAVAAGAAAALEVAALLLALRWMVDDVKFAVASRWWEGRGRPGDPRNDRAELTRAEWRAAGRPWRYRP